MKTSHRAVLSHARDEVRSIKSGRSESDVRYWTTVEIRGERWFQVESCSHTSGEAEIKTFIMKDFSSAKDFLCRLTDSTWTSLRIYTRAPLLRPEGFIFEAIDKVFKLKNETLLFVLESGTALSESEYGFLGAEPLQDAKEVYFRY